MNMTNSEAIGFVDSFGNLIKGKNIKAKYAICVPFTALSDLTKMNVLPIGAENVYNQKSGAYTGEVSLSMLEDLKVDYVIIGHSERREYFNETDEIVNAKLIATLQSNVKPIMAFGETEEQFDSGKTLEVITRQLKNGLKDIQTNDVKKIIFAYEPIWAIGTGKSATPQQAQDICKSVREVIKEITNSDVSDQAIIQYGGSVKPGNVKELMSQPDIDGALVGGASLDANSFFELVNWME